MKELPKLDPDGPLPYTLLVKGKFWYFRRRNYCTVRLQGEYRSPSFMRQYHRLVREHGLTPEIKKPDNRQVYFVAWDGGPIKIGVADCQDRRMIQLQNGCPYELKILAVCKGGRVKERSYHQLFAKYRLRGEWFERCPEIEAEIERLQKPTAFSRCEPEAM